MGSPRPEQTRPRALAATDGTCQDSRRIQSFRVRKIPQPDRIRIAAVLADLRKPAVLAGVNVFAELSVHVLWKTPKGCTRTVNQKDIELLYRTRSAHFVGLATWLVGSRAHAEEIVQDVFINLLARPPKLRDDAALQAYVRRSVVNGGNSFLRRRALERRHARPAARDSVEDIYADAPLRSAVQQLPLRQRQCVVLRYYEDLTIDQIAAALNMRPGTVKSHLHRGLATLGKTVTRGAFI